ncbi:alpha/beta hydrolase [Arenimonas terrae]|uniref:Alpha/beta hydrolase n=1 Tax=Arenimonas terrae TaxID=2546226 RepID=A0A5C4RVQ4_9GAMM|nr:alpha/beta hydrolase [Arenimonas terrae]TNJ34747.1 alpha/beta hydrolase [Arenimonas terrae]
MRHLIRGILLCACLCLGACMGLGRTETTIPTALIAAPQATAQRVLVVVLPGRGDDLEGLRRSGIAEAIQGAWPEADVELVAMTMPYYFEGRMPQRLHSEVIEPARRRGYAGIWLAGASMGGMGTLLYERQYPGQLDGLVLMAPYLGDRGLIREIAAKGLKNWSPGAEPVAIDAGNYQREVWRDVQAWSGSGRSKRAWLAYGDADRLARAMPALRPALVADQVLVRPGGHAWVVWSPAAGEIFARIRAAR